MLKRYSYLLTVILLINIFSINAHCENSEQIDLSAKSAVLLCADNGEIIYGKNEDEHLPMASTTKIMTSLLAFENSESLDKEIEITEQMVKVEGSSMGLLPGNKLTLKNIARGMMMCSGNDAANTIAISISGDSDKFCELMNEKAKLIGLENTHFETPSGLDRDNHYSTAKDMSILGAYAMENKDFSETVCCKTIKVPFIEPQETRTYKNHNKLLWLYDECIGIKTGFTKKAGRCLVSCAEKNGVRLIVTTLNAHSDWDDHKKLYDYGFSKLSNIKLEPLDEDVIINIVGSTEEKITANVKMEKSITLKNEDIDKIEKKVEIPQFLNAPIEKGQVVGKVVYYLNDKILCVNELVSNQDINYEYEKRGFWGNISNFFINIFS